MAHKLFNKQKMEKERIVRADDVREFLPIFHPFVEHKYSTLDP